MSAEFNPGGTQADIINHMAESGELVKSKKRSEVFTRAHGYVREGLGVRVDSLKQLYERLTGGKKEREPSGKKGSVRSEKPVSILGLDEIIHREYEDYHFITSSHDLAKSDRSTVARSFKDSHDNMEIPNGWNDLNQAQKEEFLREKNVVNEIEVPVSKKKIREKEYLVWKKEEGFEVFGYGRNLERNEVEAILKGLGVDLKLPKDWEKHDAIERRNWLMNRGVTPVAAVEMLEADGERGFVMYDIGVGITRNQVKEIFGIDAPKEWAALSFAQKFKWFRGQRIIPAVSGAGVDVPEWTEIMIPNPNYTNTRPAGPTNREEIPNPEANARQDLGDVIARRINLMRRGLIRNTPNSDWMELEARITDLNNQIAASNDYRFVRTQVNQMDRIYKAFEVTGSIPEFNTALEPLVRTRILDRMNFLSNNLRTVMETRIPTGSEKKPLFGDLDQLIADRTGSVKSGWVTEDQAEEELLRKAQEGRHLEPAWGIGLREWYVYEVKLPNVRKILEEHRDLTSITDPEEYEKAIVRGIRKAESTNLSSSDLNNYYQRLLGLITDFPARTSQEIEARNHLSGLIQSSLLMNQVFIASEADEAAPEALVGIFKQIKNLHAEKGVNTLQMVMSRFDMSYSDGSALQDDTGRPIVDPQTGEAFKFNLGSDALNIYYDYIREEGLLGREIEDAQREGRQINQALFTQSGYRPYVLPPRGGQSNDAYRGAVKESVDKWYQENTLLGSTTQPYVNPTTGVVDDYKVTYAEVRTNEILDRLKRHFMRNRGLSQEQIDRMEVILRATNLFAQRFVLTFGWSEYDQIDIMDPETRRPIENVFGTRTPYATRSLDHPFKFLRAEKRGQVDRTNRIMEEVMPLGYKVPTVRHLVRFTDMMFLNDPIPIDRVDDLNARWNLNLPNGATVKQAVDALSNVISVQFNLTAPNAEGVATAHLIDRGHIRFGVNPDNPTNDPRRPTTVDDMIDYKEEFRDLTRFNLGDVEGDRASTVKMFGREAWQDYERNPTFANLMKVYKEVFYSGRNLRLWDNMEKALEFHEKIQQQAQTWFKYDERRYTIDTYGEIKAAVKTGLVNPEHQEAIMRRLLGIRLPGGYYIPGRASVRFAKMAYESTMSFVRHNYNPVVLIWHLFQAFMEFVRSASKQSAQQLTEAR